MEAQDIITGVRAQPRRRWGAKQTPLVPSEYINSEENLLQLAISGMLNCDRAALSLHTEFLKGALAQISSQTKTSKVLILAAEQLINTVSNTHWLDLEIMKAFFLDSVGLGVEVSNRCAARCINIGISSPQRLAVLLELDSRNINTALHCLDLTDIEYILLRVALQAYDYSECNNLNLLRQEVWVEVNSPDRTDPVSVEESEILDTDYCDDTAEMELIITLPPPPPPSPAESTVSNYGCEHHTIATEDNDNNAVDHNTNNCLHDLAIQEMQEDTQEEEVQEVMKEDGQEHGYEMVILHKIPMRKTC